MALFDLPLDALRAYRAPDSEPAGFDEFWRRTLAETRAHPLNARFEPVEHPAYRHVRVSDVTFAGWAGQPIRGWFLERAASSPGADRLPCLVKFLGYGGGRGFPVEHLAPPAAGFAHLVMDTRGQGASWSPGDTADDPGPPEIAAAQGPQHPGFMTRGIASPEAYYYRRVFADAARAVEAAAAHPRVDPARVGVHGGSQGGALALAAAALSPAGAVKVLMADVPFLCHFTRAVTMVDAHPYAEISNYLKIHRGRRDRVMETLSYFDGVHLAPRVPPAVACLFSVGLMDAICPPSTIFAAYNALRCADRDMAVFEFNGHEGGGFQHETARMEFAAARL